jgi:hypothetical protein
MFAIEGKNLALIEAVHNDEFPDHDGSRKDLKEFASGLLIFLHT